MERRRLRMMATGNVPIPGTRGGATAISAPPVGPSSLVSTRWRFGLTLPRPRRHAVPPARPDRLHHVPDPVWDRLVEQHRSGEHIAAFGAALQALWASETAGSAHDLYDIATKQFG